MKLNLGCGHNIKEGWVNLDIEKRKGVDVVHNLEEFPYPFKSNHFDLILADNVLEHLEDTIGVMAEIHRILKPRGQVILRFPYFQHPNAWVDPTHKKCLTAETFNYFVKQKKRIVRGKSIHGPVKSDKQFTEFEYRYKPTWIGYSVYPFIRWLRHFCDILILDVEVKLTK